MPWSLYLAASFCNTFEELQVILLIKLLVGGATQNTER